MDSFYVWNVLNEREKNVQSKIQRAWRVKGNVPNEDKNYSDKCFNQNEKKVFWVGDKLRYYKKE